MLIAIIDIFRLFILMSTFLPATIRKFDREYKNPVEIYGPFRNPLGLAWKKMNSSTVSLFSSKCQVGETYIKFNITIVAATSAFRTGTS